MGLGLSINSGCDMALLLGSKSKLSGHSSTEIQTKDYKIGICCFCVKHAAIKGKSRPFFYNVYECERHVSPRTVSVSKLAEKLLILALNNNHPITYFHWH